MSFLELSDELLLRIFTLSKGPAPFNTQDICSIILTCRRFYRVALHDVLYREIEFWRGDAARFTRFLHTITVHPEHASSVRDAVFTWSRGDAKAWELAFDIIPRLSSMHTLALQVENDDDYDPDSDSVVIIDINDPDAPEPERRLSFSDFLLQCVHLPIRTLCVADDKISTEDIENFSAIRALEHLRIFYFDSNVSDMTGLVVPSNAPPSTIIKLEFRLSMLPPTAIAGSVPSMLKHYPHLQDLIWEFTDDCIDFCPTDFIRALLPIKATLVKLSLLLDTRTTMEKHRLDLSQLTALKVLRVHERLIFDVNHQNTEWAMSSLEKQVVKHDPLGLSQRLPATLEQLEIIFDHASCFLTQFRTREADAEWILALAHNKNAHFKRLSAVTIIEDSYLPRPGWKPTDTSFSEYMCTPVEWKYPKEARLAYQDAGIHLAVFIQ